MKREKRQETSCLVVIKTMTYLEQCRTCHYWHEDDTEWAPFCDLFHGNGIAVPCNQHMTPEDHKSLVDAIESAKYEKAVPFKDVLDRIATEGNRRIIERDENKENEY